MKLRYLLLACVLLTAISWSGIATGQETDGDDGGVYTIDLGDDVIKGRVQKPEAWYILQHANLSYKSLDPKTTFIPQLLETVKKEPF